MGQVPLSLLSYNASDRFRFFDIVTRKKTLNALVSVCNMPRLLPVACLLLLFEFTFSKHFEICELASIFKDHFPPEQVNDCK